jgi:hypothetical protein
MKESAEVDAVRESGDDAAGGDDAAARRARPVRRARETAPASA